MSNVPTVQNLYAAFGRSDLPAVLSYVTDDVSWGFNGARPDRVGYHQPVAGKAELPGFFAHLAEEVEFRAFEPRRFIDGGSDVVVEVHIAFTLKATGRSVDQSQLHWWSFDDQGRIRSLVHYEDTAAVLAAAEG